MNFSLFLYPSIKQNQGMKIYASTHTYKKNIEMKKEEKKIQVNKQKKGKP